MRKPWIRNRKLAATLGIGLFVVACALIYDAYDRRGRRAPLPIRLISPL